MSILDILRREWARTGGITIYYAAKLAAQAKATLTGRDKHELKQEVKRQIDKRVLIILNIIFIALWPPYNAT